jgi:HEAT repeat protein
MKTNGLAVSRFEHFCRLLMRICFGPRVSDFGLALRVVAVLGLAFCDVRADQEQDLITILKSNAGAPQKCDACQKLRLIGTAQAVPALAALLTEEPTAHAARYALEGLPFTEAVVALREALVNASGPVKVGLIDSLGWRRDAAAVPLLNKSLLEPDPAIACAAAGALGRIGGQETITALTAAREKVPLPTQFAVLDALSRCADQLLAGGDAKRAAALYRSLTLTNFPDRIRMAAWRGLVMADPGDRTERVARALAGQEPQFHAAALMVLRELNDSSLVEACLRQWFELPADAQLALLEARLKLGGDVLPCVRTATESPHLAVRAAAWQAMADLGAPAMVPALARAAVRGEPAERTVAREALARLRGPGVREALLTRLDAAEPEEKVELLRALGERGDIEAVNVLLQQASAQPTTVRLAALEALRKLAAPDTAAPLLALAARSSSEAESTPVLEALFAVCQASANKEQTAHVVLDAMKRFSTAERRLVLPVLAELATPSALEAAQAATREQDPELVRQAVRVLSQWPGAAPAATLLALARTATDPALQVFALRGCIGLIGQEPDPAQRLALLRQAMAAAKRPEEKKQALGQLGQVPTPEALQTTMACLADPDLANEAGLAAMMIAEKLAATQPELARETAAKVLAQCNTSDIVKRAWAIRGKPVADGPFIEDWLVCGPFSKPGATGAQVVFDLVFAPEEPGASVQWAPLPRAPMADLAGIFPNQANCVVYLRTQIIAPQDCDAALLLGSDDGVKAWLNGAVVHSNNVDRGLVADQDMAPIALKKGANELLLKITQGGGGWTACAKVVGRDGRPIRGLQVKTER